MNKNIIDKLVKYGLITNIEVDADKYESIDDLINKGIITIPGIKQKIIELIGEESEQNVETVTVIEPEKGPETEPTTTVIEPEKKPETEPTVTVIEPEKGPETEPEVTVIEPEKEPETEVKSTSKSKKQNKNI